MKVLLAVPSGGTISEDSSRASWLASYEHEIFRQPFIGSGNNFNRAVVEAMNVALSGKIDLLVMLGIDVTLSLRPEDSHRRWVDVGVEEMLKKGVSFLSVPTAIKDPRKLTSSGFGDPDCRWRPYRRLTSYELDHMPMTFTAQDVGYGDRFLLHNQHCCFWDLRDEVWYQHGDDGVVPVCFNFVEQIRYAPNAFPLLGGKFVLERESEDWHYSRALWKAGVKSALTRRILIKHHGGCDYENTGKGLYESDRDTCRLWENGAAPRWPAEALPYGDAI